MPKAYRGRIFDFCPSFCVTWLWTWHGPSVARSWPSVPYGVNLLLLLLLLLLLMLLLLLLLLQLCLCGDLTDILPTTQRGRLFTDDFLISGFI